MASSKDCAPAILPSAFAYVRHWAQPLTLKTIRLGQGRLCPSTPASQLNLRPTTPLTHFILTRVGSYGAFGLGLGPDCFFIRAVRVRGKS